MIQFRTRTPQSHDQKIERMFVYDDNLINQHSMVKIIDFGSTKIAGIEESLSPLKRDNQLGTRNYTVPEYLHGNPASNRSDIFPGHSELRNAHGKTAI
ncbi:MAG: hypothetical protein KKE76_08815 [Gammaproteobacteria bacterium]|nr:hypothetical protein [Gammaproteobacteria bacterium]